MLRMMRILSIDGGGIRGLVPALILAEIERRTGRAIADLFDMIVGTSTGGLIGLGLSVPDGSGRPKYAAEDLVRLYEEHGHEIFSRSLYRRLHSPGALTDERYDCEPLEKLLRRYFGDARLHEALTELVITSYDIELRIPYFFKRSKAREDPRRDCLMWHAARATSAAPTYFEPFRLPIDGNGYRALVDGGVFANNPTLCGYAEAQQLVGGNAEVEFLVLSLGTGELVRRYQYDEAKDWGLIGWARPVLDIVFDGVADTIDYQMRKLLEEFKDPTQYYRVQGILAHANDDMDDATPGNLRLLRLMAEQMIEDHDRKLTDLCRRLMKGKKRTAARVRGGGRSKAGDP